MSEFVTTFMNDSTHFSTHLLCLSCQSHFPLRSISSIFLPFFLYYSPLFILLFLFCSLSSNFFSMFLKHFKELRTLLFFTDEIVLTVGKQKCIEQILSTHNMLNGKTTIKASKRFQTAVFLLDKIIYLNNCQTIWIPLYYLWQLYAFIKQANSEIFFYTSYEIHNN